MKRHDDTARESRESQKILTYSRFKYFTFSDIQFELTPVNLFNESNIYIIKKL